MANNLKLLAKESMSPSESIIVGTTSPVSHFTTSPDGCIDGGNIVWEYLFDFVRPLNSNIMALSPSTRLLGIRHCLISTPSLSKSEESVYTKCDPGVDSLPNDAVSGRI